ncbi:MAG: creatininase family protein [Desulfurococcales archaeon]|nr:creatininase family protein [Desulfurococcales archaeon]
MPLLYHELSTPEIRSRASDERVILVIPVGSVEQHCNAPSGLDYMISLELSIKACRMLEDRKEGLCIVVPPIPYGFSPEWYHVGGTISLSLDTMRGLIHDLLSSLEKTGFRRIALVNAHGGNSGLLDAVVREWLSQRSNNIRITIIDYWKRAGILLGHADKIEEAIAKYLGVINAGFSIECEETTSLENIRQKPGPKEEAGILGSAPETANNIGELVVEAVYKALRGLIS